MSNKNVKEIQIGIETNLNEITTKFEEATELVKALGNVLDEIRSFKIKVIIEKDIND